MRTVATNYTAIARTLVAGALALMASGCARADAPAYVLLFTSKSPDGAYVATVERMEEGTLGSTRYQMFIATADGSARRLVVAGTHAYVSAPVWQDASTVILPLCFGSLQSVTSVLNFRGSKEVHFRTSTSSNVRVHVVTAPDTTIAGVSFCSSKP